jgi:hypothetical protein
MAVTYYVALPFVVDDGGSPVPGPAKEVQSEGSALRMASAMAALPDNCGAIAFSRTGDPATGDFDDAVVIRAFGEVDAGAMAG